MKRVVILQHRLLHYRLQLFSTLRAACEKLGIELIVIHGQPSRRELAKKDTGELPFAHAVKNVFFPAGRTDLLWQPFPKEFRDADLIVMMQESRILSNYPILARRIAGHARIAYWGHGANLQSRAPNGARELWKKQLLRQVDWWFAYTERTSEILLNAGYPKNRITCLNNAIDNEGFSVDLSEAPPLDLKVFSDCKIPPSKIAIYCGSLYPEKRLDFLVEACDLIKSKVPDFGLIVVGDGPSFSVVQAAAATRPWMLLTGAKRGKQKATCFKASSLVLNPGAVGLHVLDAFAAGLPMITTVDAMHGPEIAYLRNGLDGVITPGTSAAFASAVIDLYQDENRMIALHESALARSKELTLKNMVGNFASGILDCLSAPANFDGKV